MLKQHKKKEFAKFFESEVKCNSVSYISQNCIGQRFYLLQKTQYRSPTIGLWMKPRDFLDFALNLREYLNQKIKLVESDSSIYGYPVGKIGDAVLYFQHYSSFKHAEQSWERRCERVNYSNLFFILTDRDGFNEVDFKNFLDLPTERKILFTNNSSFYSENVILLPKRKGETCVGDLFTDYQTLNSRKVRLRLKSILSK